MSAFHDCLDFFSSCIVWRHWQSCSLQHEELVYHVMPPSGITRSKLKWDFPFCEKYDQIWAVILISFIIQAYEEVQTFYWFLTEKLCILEEHIRIFHKMHEKPILV
jgi:hypothetical protein